MKKKISKVKRKMEKVFEEFSEGDLHSGSKKGPIVTNRKQAVAIAINSAKKKSKKKNR